MLSIRWRKPFRDLWTNEMRTLLAILAIAVGIFGIGAIMSAYAILTREIDANLASSNPAAATLFVEGVDSRLADDIAALPSVADAEVRRRLRARLQVGPDSWIPIILFVIDDFDDLRVSTFTTERGEWPPADSEILIERSSVSVSERQPGSVMTIQTPNGQPRELLVTGVIFDPARAPGWQDGLDYGYITLNTLQSLGEAPTFDQLHLTVADWPSNVQHITDVADQVRDLMEARGFVVSAVSIPTPGVHPHADQMDSLMFLLEAFGILALILSGFLVANIVSALLAGQVRQIGAMKAIGARTYQIAGLYLATVLAYGAAALVIAIPLSVSAGRIYAEFTARLLNLNIAGDEIPFWVFAVQVVVGLSVPLLASAPPILRGSRMTVQEAISDYGIGSKMEPSEGLVTRIRGVSRPLLLSLRNTFRRRARLILIVGILAAGGATFISAFNVRQSWTNTIDRAFRARNYDLKIDLTRPYAAVDVEEAIGSVPGVVALESWVEALVVQKQADGTDGIRFRLTAVPPSTEMIGFPIMEGRWLRSGDMNAIVINHELYYDDEVAIRAGDTISLKIGDQVVDWEVVGVVSELGASRRGLGTPISAYVSLDSLAEQIGLKGMATTVRVQSAEHHPEALGLLKERLERSMDDASIRRLDVQTTSERQHIVEEHMVVIFAFLLIMALLVATVGGLALASVISINVMERRREIGIMRAVGASTRSVLTIIIAEGMLIGLLSGLFAIVAARPLSVLIGDYAGWIFIRSPLESAFPAGAMAAWLVLILLISAAASFYPAWTAARLTVREAVAYE